MISKQAPRILYGPQKWAVDLQLLSRVLTRGTGRLGPLRLLRELYNYSKGNRNIRSGSADRYVSRKGEVFAASAMPPVTSDRFVNYVIDEIVSFNHGKRAPTLFALLCVSSRCPYRCKHCYALEQLHQEEKVPFEKLKEAVIGFARRDIKNIFLTGGEPMMRIDDVERLIATTSQEVESFWLVSTGWGMTRETLSPLLNHKLKGVVISLDGRNRDEVAASKGHPKAFDNAIKAIQEALYLDLLVSVDCMMTPERLETEEFLAYMRFIRDLGVHFVNFFPPHRIGGVEKFDLPVLTTHQLDEIENLMNMVNRGRSYAKYPVAYSAVIWERRRGCSGGKQFIYVDPEGAVRPCPFLKIPAGNICETSVEETLNTIFQQDEQKGCYAQYKRLEIGSRTESKAVCC